MKNMYRAHARHSRRKYRATTILEFAIILPIFLFMMLFTIDMGTVILISGSMNDATYSAARAGSQNGGAGVSISGGAIRFECKGTGPCNEGRSWEVLEDGAANIPFAGGGDGKDGLYSKPVMYIVSGAQCENSSDMVTIRTTYSVNLITPGLNTMLSLMQDRPTTNAFPERGWVLNSVGVARCEIVR